VQVPHLHPVGSLAGEIASHLVIASIGKNHDTDGAVTESPIYIAFKTSDIANIISEIQ